MDPLWIHVPTLKIKGIVQPRVKKYSPFTSKSLLLSYLLFLFY